VTEIWQLDGTRQLQLIDAGELSCLELIDAHLARIDRVNPAVNAVTETLRGSARAAAKQADESGARGRLRGLPFAVKGDIDCFGSPTSRGVPALSNALPYADAPVVARLKAAGAIPIARTNLSEMGMRLCTDNPLHGRTLNPFDRSLTVGGSSGGDAAAVATGMTPLGIGGDLGGSLRVPAACTGCVTLKATRGRVPHASSLPPRDYGPATNLLLSVGPITRSVADLQLLLPIIAGRDIRDPLSVAAPLGGPIVERSVAVVSSFPGVDLPRSAVDAVDQAAHLLRNAGWTVEEASPPDLPVLSDLFTNLLASELDVVAGQLAPFVSDGLSQHLARLARSNAQQQLSPFTIHTERARLAREWSQFFNAYPLLLGPNLCSPIWPIDRDLHPTTGIAFIGNATHFIVAANVLGIPSLAMPMGVVDGLPTSVLIHADLWREDLCLEAALAIESQLPAARPVDPH